MNTIYIEAIQSDRFDSNMIELWDIDNKYVAINPKNVQYVMTSKGEHVVDDVAYIMRFVTIVMNDAKVVVTIPCGETKIGDDGARTIQLNLRVAIVAAIARSK